MFDGNMSITQQMQYYFRAYARLLKLILCGGLLCGLAIGLSSCTHQLQAVATTADGRILLMTESVLNRKELVECLEERGNPPRLQCSAYSINFH